jgi:MerR family mercuric resistance operon transcriptional regulator
MGTLTIGTLAREAEVGVEAVRFYQRKRLVDQPSRTVGGIRRYGAEHVARIRFIKAAQGLGFSLEEIRSLLQLDDGVGCAQARKLGEEKLAVVRARLGQLERVESVLRTLVRECGERRGKVRCPLISALEVEARRPTRRGGRRSGCDSSR